MINKLNKAYLLLLAVVMTVFFGNFSSFAAVTAGNWELLTVLKAVQRVQIIKIQSLYNLTKRRRM